MSKRGRKFTIYGAYGSKSTAEKAERKHKGAFILKRRIRGDTRYVVMKEK